jgi:hypothetical protein
VTMCQAYKYINCQTPYPPRDTPTSYRPRPAYPHQWVSRSHASREYHSSIECIIMIIQDLHYTDLVNLYSSFSKSRYIYYPRNILIHSQFLFHRIGLYLREPQ